VGVIGGRRLLFQFVAPGRSLPAIALIVASAFCASSHTLHDRGLRFEEILTAALGNVFRTCSSNFLPQPAPFPAGQSWRRLSLRSRLVREAFDPAICARSLIDV